MIHYVYKIINLKNQLYYIGSRTHPDPENDDYMGSSKIMNNLYRIEGKENFRKEIIQEFDTRKEANIKENELIIYSLINYPQLVYNLKPSGVCNENDKIWNRRNDIWEDFYDEIRSKYLNGIRPNQLCKIYKCDRGTIGSVIEDLLINNKWSNAWKFEQEIINDYNNGYSRKYLAKIYKCDIGTIKTILLKNNIKVRSMKEQIELHKMNNIPTKNKKTIDLSLLNKLYFTQNLSLKETSKLLGICGEALKRILLENNIHIKSYKWANKQPRHKAWKLREEIKKDLENMLKKDILKKYNIKDYSTLNKIIK
jgi:predicted HTH domain antitoxin